MRRTRYTSGLLLALGTSVALASESDSSRPPSPAVSPASPSEEGEGFGYFGKVGPRFWGRLDPAWGTCSNGKIQAPVDLGRSLVHARRFHDLDIDYQPTTGEIFNNGHTIEIETE